MDFFNTIDDFRNYIAIPASTQVVALASVFRPAKRKVQYIIGKATYKQLLDHYTTPPGEDDAVLDEALEYIQAVLANMVHIDWFKQQAGQRNASDKKLFKYQEDQAIEINITNIWSEMGQLIALLESDEEKFADFAATDIFKERQKLVIKNANEFEKSFGIDSSGYFFMRTVYLQKEVITDMLEKRGVVVADIEGEDDKYIYAIHKAVAYEVMSMACRRFEYPELPASIRNDLADEMRRRVYKSSQATFLKETLYQEFHNKALEYLGDVEDYLQKQKSGSYAEPEDVNDESNNFFFTT
ncbi:hypothetical protein [Carboxylicivirga marina]|uniref:hypothetical protein n=1 Tax=Carboxylicivirga marina TaxID=2800988 RepID=UPI002593AFA8|nr:hypothetical protein [uncultured Carboxylicivirga sp.]